MKAFISVFWRKKKKRKNRKGRGMGMGKGKGEKGKGRRKKKMSPLPPDWPHLNPHPLIPLYMSCVSFRPPWSHFVSGQTLSTLILKKLSKKKKKVIYKLVKYFRSLIFCLNLSRTMTYHHTIDHCTYRKSFLWFKVESRARKLQKATCYIC